MASKRGSGIAALLSLAAAIILSLAGMMEAWGPGLETTVLEPRLERACYREIRKRSPLGHRELRTFAYDLVGLKLGVATGGLKSELRPGRWSSVNWECRIHPTSGEIIRVQFSWPQGSTRLGAISAAI
ncbi:MAG: hypothetical protein R3F54_06650 [Alphaproteobacteria bacterium]